MAETVQGVLDLVAASDVLDMTPADALAALNRRWRVMVGEARALRQTVTVGTTTAGVSFYAFAPVEAYSFEVAGVPFGKARPGDDYASTQGSLWVTPDGSGLIQGDANSTGADGITIIPTPSASGLAITSFAAVLPGDLTVDATGNTLLNSILKGDFTEELAAGVLAAGFALREANPAAAAPYEQSFAAGVQRLKLRTQRRYRGRRPSQIRILGVNA
jgi:hypothetical protein